MRNHWVNYKIVMLTDRMDVKGVHRIKDGRHMCVCVYVYVYIIYECKSACINVYIIY